MKLITLAGVMFVASLLLVGSVYAQIPVGTTSITFDGFCDGATISYTSGSFISGTHDNWDCHGGQTFIAGVSGQDLKVAPGEGSSLATVANMADHVGILGLNNGALQLYLDFEKNTFSFYEETDGVQPERLVKQGNFKIVPSPASATGGVAAWQGPVSSDNPAPNPGPAYPSGTYTIYFSGYCDRLHLTTDGNRVGGIHDFATNCNSPNAPVAANDSSLAVDVDGTGGASLIMTDSEFPILGLGDRIVTYYLNFATQTFVVYEADVADPTLFFANSGTFLFFQNGPFAPIQPPSGAGLPMSANP